MKRKIKKWLKIILISLCIFIGIIVFGKLFSNNENIKLVFNIEETGEELNGEIIMGNISLGYTQNGKIEILKENLSVGELLFKTNYNGEEFEFYYDIYEEDTSRNKLAFIVNGEQLNPKKINLIFYENSTRCELNGEIYVQGKYIGKTESGKYLLDRNIYKEIFDNNSTELYISGLTDSCFELNVNLPFVRHWEVYDLAYYFENSEDVIFEESFNPRAPENYETMQKFIRPKETIEYYNKEISKYIKNDSIEENLDEINGHSRISYTSDWSLFNEAEYWQTPSEVIKEHRGDCEDWAITTLSFMKNYNSSISCYNTLWETHMGIFCYFDNKFIIYDQDRVKSFVALNANNKYDSEILQENKSKLRKMLNDYFEEYGIDPLERRLYALFNEEELITFEENEEFINWAVSLI